MATQPSAARPADLSSYVAGWHARGAARPESDVDLLVEGLPFERLIEATVRADRLLAEASADLVPADRVRPEVLTRALAEGILLHGG